MLEFLDNFKTSTTRHVQTTDDKIHIPFKMAKRLSKMDDGNHIYLAIKYLDRYEVVKFTKDGELREGLVPVERDVLGQGRKNFPCSSCVVADWNSIQLREFICAEKGGC